MVIATRALSGAWSFGAWRLMNWERCEMSNTRSLKKVRSKLFSQSGSRGPLHSHWRLRTSIECERRQVFVLEKENVGFLSVGEIDQIQIQG